MWATRAASMPRRRCHDRRAFRVAVGDNFAEGASEPAESLPVAAVATVVTPVGARRNVRPDDLGAWANPRGGVCRRGGHGGLGHLCPCLCCSLRLCLRLRLCRRLRNSLLVSLRPI